MAEEVTVLGKREWGSYFRDCSLLAACALLGARTSLEKEPGGLSSLFWNFPEASSHLHVPLHVLGYRSFFLPFSEEAREAFNIVFL